MILVKHVIHSVGNLKPEIRWLPVLLPSSHLKWNDLETGVHQAAYLLLQLHTSQEGKPYLMGEIHTEFNCPSLEHCCTGAVETEHQNTARTPQHNKIWKLNGAWILDTNCAKCFVPSIEENHCNAQHCKQNAYPVEETLWRTLQSLIFKTQLLSVFEDELGVRVHTYSKPLCVKVKFSSLARQKID